MRAVKYEVTAEAKNMIREHDFLIVIDNPVACM